VIYNKTKNIFLKLIIIKFLQRPVKTTFETLQCKNGFDNMVWHDNETCRTSRKHERTWWISITNL